MKICVFFSTQNITVPFAAIQAKSSIFSAVYK